MSNSRDSKVQHSKVQHSKVQQTVYRPDEPVYPHDLRRDFPPAVSVDLRRYVQQVYNQAPLNSCAANAVCAVYSMELAIRLPTALFNPSALFLYYNTRVREDSVSIDDGTTILDDFRELNDKGVCKESEWPFLPAKVFVKPPRRCYTSAKRCLVPCMAKRLLYHKQSRKAAALRMTPDDKILQLKACLSDRCPFVFGFNVYQSFEDQMPSNGIMPMPNIRERPIGGHAVVAVGFNEQNFIVLNSWGTEFGDQGYFYMPHNFMVDHKWCYDHYKVSLD